MLVETQALQDAGEDFGTREASGPLDTGYPKYFGNPVHDVPSASKLSLETEPTTSTALVKTETPPSKIEKIEATCHVLK